MTFNQFFDLWMAGLLTVLVGVVVVIVAVLLRNFR